MPTGALPGVAICGRSLNLLASETPDRQFSLIDVQAQVLYQWFKLKIIIPQKRFQLLGGV